MKHREIILIGPTSNLAAGRAGGVTIPFEEFVSWCRKRAEKDGILVRVCPLTGSNIILLLVSYLRALLALISPRRAQYVSLHLNWNAVIFFAPWILFTKMSSGKSVVIRKFAGDLDQRVETAPWMIRKLVSDALSVLDAIYLETNYLVEWAQKRGLNALWWPNSRFRSSTPNLSLAKSEKSQTALRLVYLGRINVGKGIRRLINMAKLTSNEIEIEVYGPVDDPWLLDEIANCGTDKIHYSGLLPHIKVTEVIANADALVLPTEWQAEGYPGVIIEAAMVGTPTLVSAAIRGPVELVRLLGAGWVIDFDDEQSVSAALQKIRTFRGTSDSLALLRSAMLFDSESVFEVRYAEIDT